MQIIYRLLITYLYVHMYRDAKQNLCIVSKGNHFSCMYTTEMGNMAMEWKFYGLFGDIFKNCEKLSYEAWIAIFLWLAEYVYAPRNFNFNFWDFLRPVWPPKSYISTFSCKYHISIAFFNLRLFSGLFDKDLILLQKLQKIPFGLWPQSSFEASETILGANW